MAQSAASSPPVEAVRRGVSRGVFVAVVVIVAIIAAAGGIFAGKALYGGSSSKTQYLVVGTNVPFPPFESYNSSTNSYYGLDINFSHYIATALGRTLVIDNYEDFTTLLVDVGHGVVDMAASAITESGSIGAARNATMTFSIPYYDANQAVLVKNGSSLHCPSTGCTVANLSSLKIGVQTGTSSQAWTSAYLTPGNETGGGAVTAYATVDTEVTLLLAGTLDAVIIDYGPALSYASASSGQLVVAGEIFTNELYGFAVQHGDPEHILTVIDYVINQCVANGTYNAWLKYWFP